MGSKCICEINKESTKVKNKYQKLNLKIYLNIGYQAPVSLGVPVKKGVVPHNHKVSVHSAQQECYI